MTQLFDVLSSLDPVTPILELSVQIQLVDTLRVKPTSSM